MGKPEIDWKVAPKTARWWAIDADGRAHWYCMPDIKPFTNFWGVDMVEAPMFEFGGDWRTSLVERPT